MEEKELKELIEKGETSTVQFKGNITNERSIAQEMVAFANSRGGTILIGIDDKNSFALHTLPYRGLGSGIKLALETQPDIEFINDVDGEQFKVIIPRPEKA